MASIQEEPGRFYLGPAFDPSRDQPLDSPVYCDAHDLTTHAAILGMTGNGKTGLGIILREGAALNGISAIAIAPKGDMPDLLLTFPDLEPGDFAPWVDPTRQRRHGMDVDTYAGAIAEQWRRGLAETGQAPDAAVFAVYTPGSSAGRYLSSVYIAHLSEAEPRFFLTLLLDQVIGWMRAQPGTTGLRAFPYMDELFGSLPPYPTNPPTRRPLLTLLRQARAYGLGLVLTTQNPVALDYKALTNAGHGPVSSGPGACRSPVNWSRAGWAVILDLSRATIFTRIGRVMRSMWARPLPACLVASDCTWWRGSGCWYPRR